MRSFWWRGGAAFCAVEGVDGGGELVGWIAPPCLAATIVRLDPALATISVVVQDLLFSK